MEPSQPMQLWLLWDRAGHTCCVSLDPTKVTQSQVDLKPVELYNCKFFSHFLIGWLVSCLVRSWLCNVTFEPLNQHRYGTGAELRFQVVGSRNFLHFEFKVRFVGFVREIFKKNIQNHSGEWLSRWWQLKYFSFSPRKLGKIPILTIIFFRWVETTN